MPLVTYMQPVWALAHRLSSLDAATRTRAFFDADKIIKGTDNSIVSGFLSRRLHHEIKDEVILLRRKNK